MPNLLIDQPRQIADSCIFPVTRFSITASMVAG
jgi:hypothetical protein